jgi:LuxR family maltose regulon positive regulatory protein
LGESLSTREQEVLDHLVQGRSNREIARSMGISPQTVQTHIRNLHAKLDVGSRLEAVTKALRLGLASPPQ